jgi:predicted transcriptional regulator of viral defense system
VSDPSGQQAEAAFPVLYRSTVLAGRPGIVVLEADLPALEERFGSRARSRALIHRLERSGRLRQVRRGAYTMVDAGGNVRAEILDLVAALTPKPYAVTAGAALQFHGLTDQHFRLLVVLVNTQLRPWSYRGQTIRYARTGRRLVGVGTRSRRTVAVVANPARAVADSLDHPAWGVTLPQVAEAIDRLLKRDLAFADTLAAEVADSYGHALARRLGYVITVLAGADAARPFLLLRGRSKAATKLSASGPERGPLDTTWGVRVNVDRAVLTQHRPS